jgi:hypothetical protein
MDVHFDVLADGVIEVRTSVGGVFDDALNDSVSSRAPRGATSQGLSTYWIDSVERDARAAAEHGGKLPFASGNITVLRVADDEIVASYDYGLPDDEDDAERVPLGDFLKVLAKWREAVVAAGGASGNAAFDGVAQRPARPMGPPA